MNLENLIIHTLTDIFTEYPQYTVAEHLASILRRKSSEGDQFFYWTNAKLLKRIEKHQAELKHEVDENIY